MQITIGLPFYNNESTIAKSIKSIISQSFIDWELILMDDGSTDRSLAIATSFSDTRIRVISDGENLGLAKRLNQITKMSSGRYIARMDADDIMHPDRIQEQFKYLEANPTIELIGSAIYTIDSNDNIVGVRCRGEFKADPTSVLRHGLFPHMSVMGRREWFESNPYDVAFKRSQDYELWCRTCSKSSFGKIDLPLVFVREEGEVTSKKYWRSCLYNVRVIRRYAPNVGGRLLTLRMIAFTLGKGITFAVLSGLGFQKSLLAKRNASVTKQDLEVAQIDLSRAINH